jgi:UDP-3-O-[3-hydroxymyristoyl] glucosamine N-acyltransferase
MSTSDQPTISMSAAQAAQKAKNEKTKPKVKQVYRPKERTTQAAHLSIRLAQDTMKSINEIRAAFYKKFPQTGYPTLSAAFEYVILRNASELLNNKALLDAEVEDFKRRYTK